MPNYNGVVQNSSLEDDLPYFGVITVGNMTHVYSNDFRELNKSWETKASYLNIRVADGLLVPQGTIIKVYVK